MICTTHEKCFKCCRVPVTYFTSTNKWVSSHGQNGPRQEILLSPFLFEQYISSGVGYISFGWLMFCRSVLIIEPTNLAIFINVTAKCGINIWLMKNIEAALVIKVTLLLPWIVVIVTSELKCSSTRCHFNNGMSTMLVHGQNWAFPLCINDQHTAELE